MNIEQIVKDKLFKEMKNVESTLVSLEACLANNEYEQAMVRLQMLGVKFTQFECDIISDLEQPK